MNQGRQENRPAAAPPAERNVPRPEARPSENRGQEQRGNDKNNNSDRNKKDNKDNKDNKDKNKPPQFR